MATQYPYWEKDTDVYCRACKQPLSRLEYQRRSRLCDDCEFELLAHHRWLPEFLSKLAVWEYNRKKK